MLQILMGIGVIASMLAFAAAPPERFEQENQAWKSKRLEGLRAENGWLTLVGLFWLHPGENSIGAAPDNEFVLPQGSAPLHLGKLIVSGERVKFLNLAGAEVKINGKPAAAEAALTYNDQDRSDVVEAGSATFLVLKRSGKLCVRAKDNNSPVRRHFAGLRYFAPNQELHIEAKFVDAPEKISVPNILGHTEVQDSPGIAEFTYKNKQYRLRPTAEEGRLFFVFKDLTSKKETYQAGRFLKADMPRDGKITLDFNQAYNPPCAFTPYATCPLPPKENVLAVRLEAGELRYGKGHPE